MVPMGSAALVAFALMAGNAPEGVTDPADSATLFGVVRDFEPAGGAGGHPDFGTVPLAGRGLYVGVVGPELDAAGKPVFASTGLRCRYQAEDARGRAIAPASGHVTRRAGDSDAETDTLPGGAVRDAASFAQWFRDVPTTNRSAATAITLSPDADTGVYVFDDRLVTAFARVGGYYPAGPDAFADAPARNVFFTCELSGRFEFTGEGYFSLSTDDDAWVFVDGKLVIDLGGVHGRMTQRIDLDRLSWLEPGEEVELRVFLADRGGPSTLRIETDRRLEPVLQTVARVDSEEDE